MVRSKVIGMVLASVLFGIAGCSSNQAPAPIADAQTVISKTDWSKIQTITVELSSYAFTPQSMTLKPNQPYILHLANASDDTHTFSSDTLFSAVAVEKVVRGSVETSGMQTNGISLAPNEQADVYVVPVKTGNYRIYCDEFMHDTMGMHGDVTIQ